eukprot:SAG31_NODE_4169_length_3511_cov_7.390680_2_plen_417_part_00
MCGQTVVWLLATAADLGVWLAVLVSAIVVALHLTSGYYGIAPGWLESGFHRWRVRRYFTVGSGPHSKRRLYEAKRSSRLYTPISLPPCGRIVKYDYRHHPRSTVEQLRRDNQQLRVVSWNIEFGYLLDELIKELQKLDADVVCLQEVDVYSDSNQRISVDVGQEIAKALTMTGVWAGHHCYADSKGNGGIWGCAILSKHDILSDDAQGMMTPAFVKLPCIAGYPRGAVIATIRCPGSIDNLQVVSMHTEVCCSPQVRLNQLSTVCKHPLISSNVASANGNIIPPSRRMGPDFNPTIVAGDFNTIGGHLLMRISPIHHLTKPPWLKRWWDGWWDALNGKPRMESDWWQTEGLLSAAPGFSDADNGKKILSTLAYSWPIKIDAKLDWMLLRRLNSTSYVVGTGRQSDHHWIMTDLVSA